MSLDKLESQIADLRAQAERLQSRWSRTRADINKDASLSEIGKREKLDRERAQVDAKLADLRSQETELISAKKQSLEKALFGLGAADSCYTEKIMSYRDAQDRAARLGNRDDAELVFTSAMRADDKILAAAVLARAVDNGWNSIIVEYTKQNPRAGDDIDDLAKIQQYDSFTSGLAYITT